MLTVYGALIVFDYTGDDNLSLFGNSKHSHVADGGHCNRNQYDVTLIIIYEWLKWASVVELVIYLGILFTHNRDSCR